MKISIASLVFCGAAMACGAGTGDKKKAPVELPPVQRGPELKVLEGLAGTYEAKVKLFADPKAPTESTGVMSRKMILDGNFLQESFKAKFQGKDFTGLGMLGYDSVKKKYFSTWFDSMSSSTALMQGSYDADKKTLTMVGEDTDGQGKKMKARDVFKIVSADEQLFEMYRQSEGAPEVKIMEISYVRSQRGPEQKVFLASLVGTYDAKVKLFTDPKAAPTESTGVMSRKLILDGNFLQETYKGVFFGKEFNGMGIIGYDALKKKFFTTWFDNMSTSTTLMQGTYDEDRKTLTTYSEATEGTKKMKARDVLRIVSAEEQVFEMYRQLDGAPEIKVMEVTYIRKK